MSTGLLSIGASALDAAYTAMRTTGNNIANVNTPGYSREVVSFSPELQTDIGGMYQGNGVDTTAISRVYSNFLGQQTNQAQAAASAADTAATLTSQINSLFSNTTTGLGNSIDSFFSAMQTLSSTPSSAAAQTAALSAAQSMTGQFNEYYAQLQSMNTSAQQQIQQQVDTVNTTVAQIAQLNGQIALASAGNQSPNALLDERDQDLQTLNQAIGVSTSTESDGAIDVYLSNGQPLLVGTHAYALSMETDPNNAQNVIVGTGSGSSMTAIDPSSSGGGAIGALLQFQSQTIPSVLNQMGQLAVAISTQYNALQATGTTPGGAAGTNFFTTPTIGVSAATSNTDGVMLSASYGNVADLQASSYQVEVENGNYVVTQLSNGQQTTFTSLPATINGVQLSVVGTTAPANGDIFTIDPVQQAAANFGTAITAGSQIATASPIQATVGSANAGTLAVGSLSLQALPTNPGTSNPYSNLLDTVTIDFTSPTAYTVTDPTTGATSSGTYTPGQAIDVNGWSLTLTGTPAAGATVTVAAGGAGADDNRNVALMTQIQSQNLVNGGTIDAGYSNLIGSVGNIASTAQAEQTSQDAILKSATSAESSVSGVNLDEEAANLMQYQQQYQAAATMIQTANTIFNTLISTVSSAA